jgi:propionate CoA-transferase
LAAPGYLHAKEVVVPGVIVDAVVVAEDPEFTHRTTRGSFYNPYLTGALKKTVAAAPSPKPVLAADDVVCRRAVYEIYPGAVINVGVGIGAGIGEFAEVEGILSKVTFTLELGTVGGTPTPLSDFGASDSAEAYVAHPSMFDFYHGGGLDITFLGIAQADTEGNVNVSKFSGRPAGQGGFIDISQMSRKVVFVSYFKTKGMDVEIADGRINIKQEGQIPKFVDQVEQITFNGKLAAEMGKEVVFVTERAVFRLTKDGVELVETAPGVDIEKDILSQMEFRPLIAKDMKQMDDRIFVPGRMGAFD